MADQWLSWRLDMIASFLILIVALLAISQRDHINPSLTAVSLTQVPRGCCHARRSVRSHCHGQSNAAAAGQPPESKYYMAIMLYAEDVVA